MKKYWVLFPFLLMTAQGFGQNGIVIYDKDSTVLEIGGYADVYFGYDFNRPADKNRPYAISSSRHDEIALNIAILQFKFRSPRARVVVSPAFGTIMEINYAAEPPLMKNLYEGYAGFRVSKKKPIWIDAGIFYSPYTVESAISMDQLTYTRSNGSENAPYYVSGLRGSFPLGNKFNAALYALNGWQIIQADHHLQSFGSALEFKASEKLNLNWTTFVGDSRTDSFLHYRNRFYSDVYGSWNSQGKVSATVCLGAGQQQFVDTLSNMSSANWLHGAVQMRYRWKGIHAVAAKLDYFSDPEGILVRSILGNKGVVISSATLNYTLALDKHVQWRMEGRLQQGSENIYLDRNQNPTAITWVFISSIAARF